MIVHLFVFVNFKNKAKIIKYVYIDDSTYACFCKFLKTR